MPQNLKQLTALRFFAAVWVVGYHYWPHLGLARPAVLEKGYLGVELFFVLSGFILSHVYLQAFGEKRQSYPSFLWARLARIYPVHIAVLGGLVLLMLAAAVLGLDIGDHVAMWRSLPAQVTLTQAWGLSPDGGWNHPSWSISAEWFAYLTFPVFAWAAWRLRDRPRLAVGLALALVVGLYEIYGGLTGESLTRATITWGALRIVPCFAYGCAIYLLWRAGGFKQRAASIACAGAAAAAVVALTHFGAPDWATTATFGLLIASLAGMASNGSRLLTSKTWVYLGEVSFALYMVCIPWELVFGGLVNRGLHLDPDKLPLAAWLVLCAGALPVAMAAHHLVERPAREIMRRYGVPFSRGGRAAAAA